MSLFSKWLSATFILLFALVIVNPVLAQPLTGTKTIGGTNPDYPTFTSANAALATSGVGTGGVTFLVRPGTYNESICIYRTVGASATNPVIFRKESGTVTISPTVTTGEIFAVMFSGCQYVTFDGIDVIDVSTGAHFVSSAFYLSNYTAVQGAQYNTIKNATIILRTGLASFGIFQQAMNPTSQAGTQSNNRFLNLKISKAGWGMSLSGNSDFPDMNTEVGSDSCGVNYSNRMVIGAMANDTIRAEYVTNGIYVEYNINLRIHDIDVTNLISPDSSSTRGISLFRCSDAAVYNNRVHGIKTYGSLAFVSTIGISASSCDSTRIFNNMVYDLISQSTAVSTSEYKVIGISVYGNATIDNNTVLINNATYYSSACVYIQGTVDTLRNNILANYTPTQNVPYHIAIYWSNGDLFSDNNCFYIPTETNGAMGFYRGYQTTQYAWISSTGQDAHSTYGDPRFIAQAYPYNLHIRLNQNAYSVVESKSIPLPYITTDIDGETRSTITPDIGADEGSFQLPPLTGIKTIGGTNPDYSTIDSAAYAVSQLDVGNGGVTFLIRPGVYYENVTVNMIPSSSATNPVIFRKESGTVTLSPIVTNRDIYGAVYLYGCKYVTFDGVDVIDISTGANYVVRGYFLTNFDSRNGARNNTIINSRIVLRKDCNCSGVNQTSVYTPSSIAGTQSNNRYLNLKISKVRWGMYLYGNATYPDSNVEIGSDSCGLNYSNRFVIGAMENDTIIGPGMGEGLHASHVKNLHIHDIDIRNIKTTNQEYAVGIELSSTPGSLTINNNRIYSIVATGTTVNPKIYGLYLYDCTANNLIYNNMVYGLRSISETAVTSNTNVSGIFANCSATIDNNTILIDNATNYSSAAFWLSSGIDTLRNNIICNLSSCPLPARSMGIGSITTTLYSDYNCFYIADTVTGAIGIYNGYHRNTILNWRTVSGQDANSVTGNPLFVISVAPYNLHIQNNQYSLPLVDERGIPLPYLTTDIDGETRNTVTPDIGADEGQFLHSPLTGTMTIGGTSPDFTLFKHATNALSNCGVGTGGVTMLVRPGTYYEQVVVNAIPASSAAKPVIFQKESGTVTISPPVTDYSTSAGVKLYGCKFVTFDGIDIADTTTWEYRLSYGYWAMNSAPTQGAHDNTIRNARIRMRTEFNTYGIYHAYGVTPTSAEGTQSNNRYLNLKISKARNGVIILSNGTYPDSNIEIGSDSCGINYPNRFVIGAMVNDTIGGHGDAVGVMVQNVNGVRIHDIDVTNLISSALGNVNGIEIYNPIGPSDVSNNRIYHLQSIDAPNLSNSVMGILTFNTGGNSLRIFNNMIYDLNASMSAGRVNMYNVYGVYANYSVNLYHNTILIDQAVGCSSTAVNLVMGTDTLYNNIFANLCPDDAYTYHTGMYMNGTTVSSDNNCFYIPNPGHGNVVYASSYRSDLAAWQAVCDQDLHSVAADPKFVSATYPQNLHIQHYQLTSPVENQAITIPSVTTDIDGEPRQNPADIGADEGDFASAAITCPDVKPYRADSVYIALQSPVTHPFRYLSHATNTTNYRCRIVNTDSAVAAGDSLRCWIRFSPDSILVYYDTLRITVAEPNATMAIPLNGVGKGSYVTLPATNMNFPTTLLPGQNTSQDLTIFIDGNQTLPGGRWITIPPVAPFRVVPSQLPSIQPGNRYSSFLFFSPTTTGNFTAQIGLVSNAINGDTLRIGVSGFSQNMPVAPGLTITVNGDNALLNWSRPDTNVTRYLVYFRNSSTIPWQFLTGTIGYNATSFTHASVVRFSPQMYYQTTAWYGTSTDSFDEIIREIPIGTPQTEVISRLKDLEEKQSK